MPVIIPIGAAQSTRHPAPFEIDRASVLGHDESSSITGSITGEVNAALESTGVGRLALEKHRCGSQRVAQRDACHGHKHGHKPPRRSNGGQSARRAGPRTKANNAFLSLTSRPKGVCDAYRGTLCDAARQRAARMPFPPSPPCFHYLLLFHRHTEKPRSPLGIAMSLGRIHGAKSPTPGRRREGAPTADAPHRQRQKHNGTNLH
jgi:hypothetical protein